MTPEKRLNQIEPFVAELSAQLDRVAAQNRQLISTAVQHTDDIQFLLHEVGDLKTGQARLEQRITGLEEGQARLEQRITGLEEGQARLEQSITGLEEGQAGLTERVDGLSGKVDGLSGKIDGISGKVDLILQLLQSGNGNGRSGE